MHTFPISARPRPTRSTLFPYPTLFRSVGQHVDQAFVEAEISYAVANLAVLHIESSVARHPRKNFLCARRQDSDRKSTRLNSSHTVSSYAVFCVKKKIGEDVQIGRPAHV